MRQAEVSARSDAGYWKWHFKACRSKLDAAVEETKELGRSVKEMPSLLAEVTYLRKLVGQATDSSEDGMVVALRDEVARLRKVLAELETAKDPARPHSGGACRAAQDTSGRGAAAEGHDQIAAHGQQAARQRAGRVAQGGRQAPEESGR